MALRRKLQKLRKNIKQLDIGLQWSQTQLLTKQYDSEQEEANLDRLHEKQLDLYVRLTRQDERIALEQRLLWTSPAEKTTEIAKPPGFCLGHALRFIFGKNAYNGTFGQICADGSEEWLEAEAAKRHREVLMIRFRTNMSLLYAALSISGNKLNSLLNPFYQIGKKLPPGE